MDCYSATQGTELDPQFKGDWVTRALGVACTIDEVVPRWIEVIPRRDDDGDNKTWVMGPVMKVHDVPKDFSFDYRNDPIPGANDPRSELRIRDLHDGEKRRYDDIDGLREALQPGDWPMRNVVSVNLGRATPSTELTKFITEELGSLAPKLEYLDISGLTHPSFGDEQLTTMVASMQRLRVLLMPHEFGPSFKDIEFHPWLEYVRFSGKCEDISKDVDALLRNCQKIERLDFTAFGPDPGGRKGARDARTKIRNAKIFWQSGGGRVPPVAHWRPETFAMWTDSVYATVGVLKGKMLADTDDPDRIIDAIDDEEWEKYIEANEY